ncbi:MAG: TIGR04283 family arsenosugar biosynthesis glycosyltransferase [Pseudomonadota bacterium]
MSSEQVCTKGSLSIVIPVLNAAAHLPTTLTSIRSAPQQETIREIVVVDGGSQDGSAKIAQSYDARVLQSSVGRGRQLSAGAAAATAPWLLFLHADTRPDPGWIEKIQDRIRREDFDQAAVFRLRFDDAASSARVIERGVAWRTKALALPYGDQGLLISRKLYDAVGGYSAIPLMEDVDLIRRIGRRRFVMLDHHVTTSAERYQRDGYVLRVLRNLTILSLYFLGVSPKTLAKLYG